MNSWGKHDSMTVHTREPFNAEPPRELLARDVLTGADAFFVRNHGPVPQLPDGSWRLSVDGLVERPLDLTLDVLTHSFPQREVVATLQCAGNRRAGLSEHRAVPGEQWGGGAVSTARWRGVPLARVLEEAGLLPEAEHIAFHAPDVAADADPPQGFGGSVPRDKALAEEVLLAWSMDGRPLPPAHGAPLRVVVPGWIGARSVKWLERITARREPSDNHFQRTAYRLHPPSSAPSHNGEPSGISLGPLPLTCDILRPADGDRLPPGPVTVTGYAFGGGRGVACVEVSPDDGESWSAARLDPAPGPWAWQPWHAELDLPAGTARIAARAWDEEGGTHPASPADLWNPEGYLNHAWGRARVVCG